MKIFMLNIDAVMVDKYQINEIYSGMDWKKEKENKYTFSNLSFNVYSS